MISSLAGNLSAKLSHQTEWEVDIDFTTTYESIHKGWFVRNTTCCPRDLRKASAKLSQTNNAEWYQLQSIILDQSLNYPLDAWVFRKLWNWLRFSPCLISCIQSPSDALTQRYFWYLDTCNAVLHLKKFFLRKEIHG